MKLSVYSNQWCAQGARGTNNYPLCRPLYALSLDGCLYRYKVFDEMKLTLTSLFSLEWGCFLHLCLFSGCEHYDWVFQLFPEMRHMHKAYDVDACVMVGHNLGWLLYVYLHPPSKLVKAVGSHGRSSLLFMMKLMVWHFVSKVIRLWPHWFLLCYLESVIMELSLIVIYVLQWCWEYVQVWTMGFGKSCSTIRDPGKHGPNCLKHGNFFSSGFSGHFVSK